MGILEKIKDIEEEVARTQRNKATEYHLGNLKARLAKLRTQLLEPSGKGGGKGEGFEVQKFGNARICMIGFPSVGKSTLLSELTETKSAVASYEFTTLTCIPGVIHYNQSKIQLLDLPGIIEGAAEGRGRGRQVVAVAKSCDMVLMVLDAEKVEVQKKLLSAELEKVGLRLNKSKPNITITPNKFGGIRYNGHSKCKLDEKQVKSIMGEYKMFNADVLVRDADCTVDDLIDTIEGNRKYIRCLYVINKIDTISIEEVDEIARRPDHVVISCYMKLNYPYLLECIWDKLQLVRVYTKKKGYMPDFDDPLVLTSDRNGISVRSICNQIHRVFQIIQDFVKDFKFANVWGQSVKHSPQTVGLNHELMDDDVIQLFKVSKNS